MPDTDTLRDYLTLAFTPYIGAVSFCRLLQEFATPTEVLRQPFSSLKPHLPKADSVAPLWRSEAIQEKYVIPALKWQENTPEGKILTLLDEDYPLALTEVYPPPPVLFARGKIELLVRPKISLVGSRDPTPQGEATARKTAAEISRRGFCVVSGLALGIDSAAHQGALSGAGSTIAVIGTGIDLIYPQANAHLAHAIAEKGLILSEFPLGTKALASNFPMRNRLIAGLSVATVVMEASLRSGSLITAHLAGEMGREVMAFPGSIYNRQSKGVHKLIKEGAKLVESAAEILEDFSDFTYNKEKDRMNNADPTPKKVTAPGAVLVLETLGSEMLHADEITNKIDLDFKEVQRILLDLELTGMIKRTAGGRFQRIIF